MLELKNISLTVAGEHYLHNINLCLMPNKINILLGAVLSGKTSLMRVIAGLEKTSGGEIWLNKNNITEMSVQKRNVAMVYQQFVNYPTMTVFENIASPLIATKMGKVEVRERTEETAKLLKLTPFLSRRPAELSGGQQQRVALARALIKDADIVLLDEPLANLDYKLREELREELPRLFAERGSIVVYATTDPIEAMLLGDNSAALHEGKVVQTGAAVDLYYHPHNLLVAEVFSDPPLNVANACKKDGMIFLQDSNGEFSLPLPSIPPFSQLLDGQYSIAFRAHHLRNQQSSTDYISFNGTVQIAEIAGSESFIHIRVGNHNWVMQTMELKSYNIGEQMLCYVDLHNIMIFDHNKKSINSVYKNGNH